MNITSTTPSYYKILSIENRDAWNYYVKSACSFDFYHTHQYHVIDGSQGIPEMFVFEHLDDFVAIPFLKRKIENTDYYDCTSVYGYTGPLSNLNFADLSSEFCDNFFASFQAYLRSQKIVSFFCVLHPLFNQYSFLKKADSLSKIGFSVAVDLKQTLEEQRSKYRRQIRSKINQLREKGFEVKLACSKEQWMEFSQVYEENMIKVGASNRYYFDDQYFENFMSATDYKTELLLAYYKGRIAAGAMVTFANNIMQLHLAGTRNEFLLDSPMKLIFDEACLLGRANNMHFMHLGSGIGGKEDSLFHFKKGFSENLFDFTVWKYIANKQVYDELVQEKLAGREVTETTLFPLYRFI